MIRRLLITWLCIAAFTVFGKTSFNDWQIKNLGDGGGIITEFASVDGTINSPVLFTPNSKSWLFYVKNLPSEELGSAKKIYFSADIMSNNPNVVRLVIGENDEWGGAMRRMGAVRPEQKPYQWQRLTLELDRLFYDSFFSCGIGIEYKAAGTWVAIENPMITTEPPKSLPPLPTHDLVIPSEFDVLSAIDFKNTVSYLEKMAQMDPVMAKDPTFAPAIAWLQSQPDISNSKTFSIFTELKNKFCSNDYAIMPIPSASEFDYSTIFPDRTAPFTMTLPRNAKDGFVCLVRNNSAKPENFTVTFSGDAAKYGSVYTLLEVDGTPDMPEELLNGATLHIGASETVGLMVRFDTIDAGNFAGELKLLPFNPSFEPKTLPLTLEVANVTLPDQLPIKTFHWDYSGAKDPEKLQLLLDGRVNTFHYGDLPKIGKKEIDNDFESVTEVIRAVKAAAPDLDATFILEFWFVRENGGWKKEYEPWLDQLVKTLEQEGVDYKHWYLEIYDEDLSPEFLASAKAIKEYNPKVQIFSDCINKEPGVIDKFAPYLDVWCPVGWLFPPYTQEMVPQLEQLRTLPSEYWIYACGPVPENPARIFREQTLLAFAWDMQASCYWTTYYLDPRGPSNAGDHYGFFYRDRNGKPVSSRRWLEWQGGLNDYLLLYLGAKSENKSAVAQTKKMSDYAATQLNAVDFWNNYTEMRTELIRLLAQ